MRYTGTATVATVFFLLLLCLKPHASWGQDEPKDFKYVHLWASKDGVTHIAKDCRMQNLTLMPYALVPQYTRNEFGGPPNRIVFTELPVGLTQDLHSPPAVQFVSTLYGRWYIKTTDGSRYKFRPGEVLFQDNTVDSPALHVPQHYSGTAGKKPCRQFIIQFNRTAEVDHPCPF